MYNNSGVKIKGLASAMAAFGMVGSAIVGLVVLFEEPLMGIMILLVGCIGSWMGSLMMAGFGELVENSYKILKLLEEEKGSSGGGAAVVQGDVSAASPSSVTVSDKEIREYMEQKGIPYGAAVIELKKQKYALMEKAPQYE